MPPRMWSWGASAPPYGIKGWVKLYSFTDNPENLLAYREFWISDPARPDALTQIEIDAARPQGQGFVGHITGCEEREQSRRYTGLALLLAKTELPALESGYYWHQLEGLRVRNRGGEDLGRIVRLMATGANDVLVVHGDAASVDQEERLLPWVEQQVVLEVDLANGVVQVDWERDW